MTSCSSIDLKAYSLGEMDRRETTAMEEHIHGCDGCREELERLALTKAALSTWPDEEMPQRIAFVSDPVFEPRWWQRVWRSGPAMGFASALVLAAAILVHGAARPAVVTVPAPVNAVNGNTASMERQVQRQIDQRVQAAVAQAVSQIEQRQAAQNLKLLAAAEKRIELRYRAEMVAAQDTIRMYQGQAGRMMVAYNNSQSGRQQ